jgi:hypothetical protein
MRRTKTVRTTNLFWIKWTEKAWPELAHQLQTELVCQWGRGDE